MQCRRPWFDPWVRRIPEIGNDNLLQYSCLENSMDRAWWVTVHRAAKSWTWLSTHTHTHTRTRTHTHTHTHTKPVRWVTSWERGQVKTMYPLFSVVLFIHASQIMGISIHTKNNFVPKLLTWTKVTCECVSESCSVMSDSLWPHGHSSWNSPGQNTGVGNWSFLQKSSQPRDQTQVSYIAGGFWKGLN